MSWSREKEVKEGDTVILWLKRGVLEPLVVTSGKEYNGRFGAYRHADLIGVPYGSRVQSRNNLGFIHLLRPNPELWTLSLPHRTQILYLPDIAFITSYLNLRPRSRVVEAGTGSGSFSHSVLRTIGKHGHLYSFEFHEGRERAARQEFERHGVIGNVTLSHRNVCKDGFGLANQADAVFLDLPAPWLAVPHLKAAIRRDITGRVCCFSPCMEQVMKTVGALNEHGFSDIQMYESLSRPHEVNTFPKPVHIADVTARLRDADIRKEERRLRQIANASWRNSAKRKLEPGGNHLEGESVSKRSKTSASTSDMKQATSTDPMAAPPSEADLATLEEESSPVTPQTHVVSRVIQQVRGHTSYLTFAVLLPETSSIKIIK